VVAMYETGHGTYKPEFYGHTISGIAQSKLIDLDRFCQGYTRQQVKKLKACVLSLAHVI
jgi:hypothetical protein